MMALMFIFNIKLPVFYFFVIQQIKCILKSHNTKYKIQNRIIDVYVDREIILGQRLNVIG